MFIKMYVLVFTIPLVLEFDLFNPLLFKPAESGRQHSMAPNVQAGPNRPRGGAAGSLIILSALSGQPRVGVVSAGSAPWALAGESNPHWGNGNNLAASTLPLSIATLLLSPPPQERNYLTEWENTFDKIKTLAGCNFFCSLFYLVFNVTVFLVILL